jgi:hypothetical protein
MPNRHLVPFFSVRNRRSLFPVEVADEEEVVFHVLVLLHGVPRHDIG